MANLMTAYSDVSMLDLFKAPLPPAITATNVFDRLNQTSGHEGLAYLRSYIISRANYRASITPALPNDPFNGSLQTAVNQLESATPYFILDLGHQLNAINPIMKINLYTVFDDPALTSLDHFPTAKEFSLVIMKTYPTVDLIFWTIDHANMVQGWNKNQFGDAVPAELSKIHKPIYDPNSHMMLLVGLIPRVKK